MTHDYKRHGTTTLFAALNVLEGTVIGKCYSRHRHTEFLRFLREIDHLTPKELDVHLIVDNYSTHKHRQVKRWFERHPRFHAHFIPTSSSWLNLVERFFREITDRRIRRGIFRSVRDSPKLSTTSSNTTTTTRNPSYGQNLQTRFSTNSPLSTPIGDNLA